MSKATETTVVHDHAVIRGTLQRLKEIRYAVDSEDFLDFSSELEKSSEFTELCLMMAEEAIAREYEAIAIDLRIKELNERKCRIHMGAETIRNIILQGMEIRGQSNITSPTLTLSKAALKPDVIIEDESAIPAEYFIQQPPKLDKRAVREAVLKDGLVIDGVSVGNEKISLTIRRK